MYGKKNIFFPDQPPSSSSSSRYPYHTTNSKKLAFISQIVYPKTLLACDDLCYLIGWNECTIAGFVPVSIISKNLLQGYHELNKAIASSFDNVQFLGNKFQTDAKQPMILGIACPEDRNIDHSVLQEFHSNGIWLNLKIGTDTGDSGDTRKKLLKLKSIYSLGYPYDPVCYLVDNRGRNRNDKNS